MGGMPAARLADPTAHGGIVTVGCPTVIIGGQPASRIGDMHACPLFTGLVPHVGGPFVLGSFTVLVGGTPQSRQSDVLVCVGPPDILQIGCPTVLVGMVGGMGGASAILGGLLAGLVHFTTGDYPKAKLQEDGSYVTQYSSSITIEGTPEFQATVVGRIDQVANTKSGTTVIDRINDSGKSMKIVEYSEPDNSFCGPNTLQDWAGGSPKGKPVYNGNGLRIPGPDGQTQLLGTGKGANVTLEYNPNLTISNSLDPEHPMPKDAVLMHEMNHGAHFMNGEADCSGLGGWTTQEEKTTILTGNPSEADYLKERGYPYHRVNHGRTFEKNEGASL